MPVVISLLRGINVGGRHMIRMDALRNLYKALGFENVRTHLQSGNVIFGTPETDLNALARRIEDAIEQQVGFRPDVILRTVPELRDAIAGNPFEGRRDIEPAKLLVVFLAREPAEESQRKLQTLDAHPEELHLRGRELFIYYPNGMARPSLSPAQMAKVLPVPGTGRNWKTVTKLLELAEKIQ